jgi:hypothetical protein
MTYEVCDESRSCIVLSSKLELDDEISSSVYEQMKNKTASIS